MGGPSQLELDITSKRGAQPVRFGCGGGIPVINLSCASGRNRAFVERIRCELYRPGNPVLFLPLQKSELEWLTPSEDTLVAWRFPDAAIGAMRNARWFLSTHPSVVKAALEMGSPAALIRPHDRPEKGSIPTFSIKNPLRWVEEADLYFANCAFSREGATLSVSPRTPLDVACISSRGYLSQLAGFLENLHAVTEGRIRLHFLGLDRESRNFVRSRYGGLVTKIFTLGDLWSRLELKAIQSRTLAEIAYSSKPALILRALEEGARRVIYSDLDLYFFRSPAHLCDRLNPSCSALLMPHWNRSFENSRRHGIYNAGLLAASESAMDFLRWWRALCLDRCSQSGSHYDDQAYLDMAPVCFPKVHSYRGGDENVGPWNFETLGVRRSGGGLSLRDGRLVGSIHATHADPQGFFEAKFAWDQMVNRLAFREHPLPSSTVWSIHEHYFPQVKRLESIYRAIGTRIGGRTMRLPLPIERFFVAKGRGITKAWSPLRRMKRSFPLRTPREDATSWISAQRGSIFRPA